MKPEIKVLQEMNEALSLDGAIENAELMVQILQCLSNDSRTSGGEKELLVKIVDKITAN